MQRGFGYRVYFMGYGREGKMGREEGGAEDPCLTEKGRVSGAGLVS